jgi:hypothetical protein
MQIQYWLILLSLVINDAATIKLRDAKLIERLNSRNGCGTGSPPDTENTCCGKPYNYGPPCNCGMCKMINN